MYNCSHLLGQVWGEVCLAQLLDGTVNPGLVLQRDHLVAEDALALMHPQPQQVSFRAGDRPTKGWQLTQGRILHESVARGQDDSLEHLHD